MKKTARGFTLVELLVVIAIVAVLAAVVVLIVNPLEMTRRSRDSVRLTDLQNIQQAINVALQENQGGTNRACNGAAGTPATCRGDSAAGTRITDGTGWVRVNLAAQSSVTVPTLPIDPSNTAPYHYTYCGSGDNWEILTVLESAQYGPKMSSDGGTTVNSGNYYEVGSVLNLLGTAPCTY